MSFAAQKKSGWKKVEIVHTPVLLNECLKFLSPIGEPFEKDAFMIDSTLGEGGHTKAMLDLNLEVHSFERDKNILEIAKKRLANYKNFYYYNNTYDKMIDSLPKNIIGNVDFILYDLGVSMFHFKKAERGFSFNENNKLDMRLGINKINAYEVINKYEKKDLERIFKEYGEIKNYSKLAEIIIKERKKKYIETAKELENIIFHNSDKSKKYGKINPATLIFQAIRIEVNDELNILKKSIENIKNILKKYGVVVIISYHSLEDRIVKRFFKDNEKTKNKDGIFKLLNSKVLKPTNEEIKLNIASRSAKLRAAQLL